jgi:AcrR family transcriptional regulator
MNQQIPPTAARRAWHFQTSRALAKQRTCDQLLEAGRRIFDERGYEAATVRDVAHAVGMSTGAVFANFTDKAALFIEVINTDCEHLHGLMSAADLSGCSTPEAVERLLVVAQDHHADQLGLVGAAVSFVWRSDVAVERRRLHGLKLIRQRLAAVLHRGVEAGELAFALDVQLVSEMIVDTYLASYKRMIFGGLSKTELRTVQQAQIRVLMAGCARASAA